MWHDRLWRIKNYSIQRLIKLELLPNIIFKKNHKCEVCVESKFSKPSFQTIEINNEPLSLIHLNIGDLKIV